MKSLYIIVVAMAIMISLAGCVRDNTTQPSPTEQVLPLVSWQQNDTDIILSCLSDKQAITRTEFRAAFSQASKLREQGQEHDALEIVCLSLHDYASYKQFKTGIDVLDAYIKGRHSDDVKGLNGLLRIMQRMDKETMAKWAQYNKNVDEKESLDAENKELFERNVALEKNAEQNQARIKELQKQIEQLKNIENIIKNRER